jgi:hypothetical protein
MAMTETNPATERRHDARAKTLRSGLIIYDEGRCTMTCTILELSAGGARLRPQDAIWVPASFDLKLPDGSRRHCDVVRKDRTDIAVRYVG